MFWLQSSIMQSTRKPSAPHCASLVLWLNCGVLVYVYCPSPGVQYPDGGMGFVFWVGGY